MDRLTAQLLAGPPATSVSSVVERLVAVQAQSMPAARLAVRVRTTGLVAADVDAALDSGALIRSWLLRGTLHLVTAADFAWLHPLLAPRFRRAGQRRRLELGLDDAVCAAAIAALPSVLPPGEPVSRADLVARFAGCGVRIDPSGQAPAHLVGFLALSGLVSLDSADAVRLLPPAWPAPRDDAVQELMRRFMVSYVPDGPQDFAAWTGLPSPPPGRADPGSAPAHPPRLLGPFDPVLLGYRDRSWIVPAALSRSVNAGGGMIAATVLVDGQVAGTWRRSGRIVSTAVAANISDEVADLGRFLGLDLKRSATG